MKRACVDLETLSIRLDAKVASVGLVIFDEEEIINRYSWPLNWRLDTGGHISGETAAWWLQQDPDIILNNLFGKMLVEDALTEFSSFYRQHNCEEIWANGPQFDCVVLSNLYKRHKMADSIPWTYKQERDCRTMFKIGKNLNVPAPENAAYHDALADAEWQVRWILAIEKELYKQ
jgi:hypothetical protein